MPWTAPPPVDGLKPLLRLHRHAGLAPHRVSAIGERHEDAVVGGIERHGAARGHEDAEGRGRVGVDRRRDGGRARLQALATLRISLTQGDGYRQGGGAGVGGDGDRVAGAEIVGGDRKLALAWRTGNMHDAVVLHGRSEGDDVGGWGGRRRQQ